MLVDHPRLEGGEEDRRRDAAEQAADQQDGEGVEVLGDAREAVQEAEEEAVQLAAVLVCKPSNDRSKDHRGAEPHAACGRG